MTRDRFAGVKTTIGKQAEYGKSQVIQFVRQ
jgi:hypothetical protein